MVPRRQPGSRYGVIVATMVMGMIVNLLLSFSYTAVAASPAFSGHNSKSIKAELFHRDHPFSARGLPAQQPLGVSEKLHIAGKRSIARARALVQRRLATTAGDSASGDGFSPFPSPSLSPSPSPSPSPNPNTTPSPSPSPSANTTTLQTSISNEAPAEYLMLISLGTPAQEFVAVADTGSDLTWLQCASYHHDQSAEVFDPLVSSSFRNLTCASNACQSFLVQYGTPFVTSCSPSCAYAYYYGDGSNTTGLFSTETINLKSVSGHDIQMPDFWFGCSSSIFSDSSLFDSANGMVGLGQGLISFPSQLGAVFGNRFSYCLVNRSLAAVQSSLLVFGHNNMMDSGALQYTPFIKNENYPFFYYLGVEGISVNGEAVIYPQHSLQLDCDGNGGTIIDSGTTFTYLDPRAFTPLMAAIDLKVPVSYNRVLMDGNLAFLEMCYDVTGNPDYGRELPTISFKLANETSWDLSLENSWTLLPNTPSDGNMLVCLAMLRAEDGAISIVGNTQQQDFLVLYDRVEQRLGFAPTECSPLSP